MAYSRNAASNLFFAGRRQTACMQLRCKKQISYFFEFSPKKAAGPQACSLDWLEPYFYQQVKEGFFCAVMEEGQIASCIDAPGMPDLADQVQEIGIYTLPAVFDFS